MEITAGLDKAGHAPKGTLNLLRQVQEAASAPTPAAGQEEEPPPPRPFFWMGP